MSAGETSVVSAAKTSVVSADKRSAGCQDIPWALQIQGRPLRSRPCVDVLAADTTDVLAADTTDVLAADNYVASEEVGLRLFFPGKNCNP